MKVRMTKPNAITVNGKPAAEGDVVDVGPDMGAALIARALGVAADGGAAVEGVKDEDFVIAEPQAPAVAEDTDIKEKDSLPPLFRRSRRKKEEE